MTLEELQAKVEALESEKEAINAKNKELLTELKTARNKNKEVDTDAYYKALDEVDNLKAENSKLNQTLGLKSKEVEKLSTTLSDLNTNLSKNKLSNVIKEQLAKYKFIPDAYEEAESYLEKHFKIENNDIITSNNKSVDEFMAEYSQRKSLFIMPSGNVGTSASGGNGTTTVTGSLNGTKSEQEAYIKAKFNL